MNSSPTIKKIFSARHLSFSKAAAELHVTPAAISQQVRGLERQLGIDLFHRKVRALELTSAGRASLPYLSDGFECLLQGVEAMHADQQLEFLTVSVPPSFGARWLVPRLERLRKAHTEFDVRIDANQNFANFTTDGVDVAIRFGRGHYPPHIVDCLIPIDLFPVCSPEFLKGQDQILCPSDLINRTLLHIEWGKNFESEPGWQMWLRAAGADQVDPEPGPRYSNDAMLVEAALAGQGVALISDTLAERELESGKLVRLFPPAVHEHTEFCYYLVYPERHRSTPKVQAFRDWLFEEIETSAQAD